MREQPAVEIRDLTKQIGKKVIVDSLTFDIPKGEVFGFLGPNGAGKTTTIRMMVGLIAKTRGQVLINGIDVDKDFKNAMQQVGAIVENPELYKYLTGYQNLRLFANMSSGVSDARIQEVVKRVGLEARINDKVKTYSLGMRQRLGLAQALLRRPKVLILDEPTNGLDPAGIRELRDHLRQLAQTEGLAVIVSSHLLSEMELMCHRVAIISNGRLIDVRSIKDGNGLHSGSTRTDIEVDDAHRAIDILRQSHPSVPITPLQDKVHSIQVDASREDIPDILQSLLQGGTRVYGVRSANQSLESLFLEMTGGGPIA